MTTFIERVQELMKRDNVSQKQLSELSHISEPSISRYLSGKTEPRMDIVVNIAKYSAFRLLICWAKLIP